MVEGVTGRPSARGVGQRGARGAHARDGQAIVEFALVFPIFMLILLSIVEFAFAFNAILATDFVSRDAALVAAEAGNQTGGDCVILRTIDDNMGAPTDPRQIQKVEIYRTNAAGTQLGSATVYRRTSSFDCTLPSGDTAVIPYERIADGFPEASRCNWLAGCENPPRPLDHVGVRVTYRYSWRTPIGSGFGLFLDIDRANSMRMEPVL